MFERLARRLGRARHERPVDQRIEGKLVAGGIEPHRLARLERGALRQEQGEALEPGLADAVDLRIAGDDIGEPRLERRFQGLLVAGLRECLGRCDERGAENSDGEGSRGRRPPPQELSNPAGEQEHHECIEGEQRQRAEQNRPAQIFRFAHSVGLPARVESGHVERRKTIGGRERVHRQQPFGRSVEARRVIEGGARGEVRRHRPRRRGRRPEDAEAVEHARRRQHLACAARAAGGAVGGGRRAGKGYDSLEHVDECAR